MFTVVVVLPTPPFWLATTITRVRAGRGSGSLSRRPSRTSSACSTDRASGVESSPARPRPASSPAVRYGVPGRRVRTEAGTRRPLRWTAGVGGHGGLRRSGGSRGRRRALFHVKQRRRCGWHRGLHGFT